MVGKKIIVYGTPSCPYCVMLEDYLKKHKVKFKKIDISDDAEAAKHVVELTGELSVPVMEIGNDVVRGFDRKEIAKKLKLKE
jgi:glutaredoxin 3